MNHTIHLNSLVAHIEALKSEHAVAVTGINNKIADLRIETENSNNINKYKELLENYESLEREVSLNRRVANKISMILADWNYYTSDKFTRCDEDIDTLRNITKNKIITYDLEQHKIESKARNIRNTEIEARILKKIATMPIDIVYEISSFLYSPKFRLRMIAKKYTIDTIINRLNYTKLTSMNNIVGQFNRISNQIFRAFINKTTYNGNAYIQFRRKNKSLLTRGFQPILLNRCYFHNKTAFIDYFTSLISGCLFMAESSISKYLYSKMIKLYHILELVSRPEFNKRRKTIH
jgi:hypothetical protein